MELLGGSTFRKGPISRVVRRLLLSDCCRAAEGLRCGYGGGPAAVSPFWTRHYRLLALCRRDVPAPAPGGVLSLSRARGVGGDARGRVVAGGCDVGSVAACRAPALCDCRVVLVSWHACAGDRAGTGGRPGLGGPIHIPAAYWALSGHYLGGG